ncbi:MAG: hypothetical protein PHY30_03125 [Candidatus Pacebacteria bacterium]|nr:hypothetical protein [Candidatus Paceibacterota bacterium]
MSIGFSKIIDSINQNEKIFDLIKNKHEKERKNVSLIIRNINKISEEMEEDVIKEIFDFIHAPYKEKNIEYIKRIFTNDVSKKEPYKNIPIKLTTILGAKGLTKDYVFLVNFDDNFLCRRVLTIRVFASS